MDTFSIVTSNCSSSSFQANFPIGNYSQYLDPATTSLPIICIVITGSKGFAPGTSIPIEQYYIDTITKAGAVALKEGQDFSYLKTSHSTLLNDVSKAYTDGARIFVGIISSPELLSIKSFIDSSPSSLWLTTTSTVFIPFVNNNVFRLPSSNESIINDYNIVLKQTFGTQEIIVVYDESDIYGRTLANLLKGKGYRNVTFPIYKQLKLTNKLSNKSGYMFLSTNNDLVKESIENCSSNLIIVGDPQSGYPNFTVSKKIYGLQQLILPTNQFVGYNVFKQNVSSYIYSLISAMWYISDIYLSANSSSVSEENIRATINPSKTFVDNEESINYPQMFMKAYGPALVNYFTSDGFGFFNPSLITIYTPSTSWKLQNAYVSSSGIYQGFSMKYNLT